MNYDGFDWGSNITPFRYGGVVYGSLAAFAAASGLEANARQINDATCFASFNVPGPAPVPIPPQYMTLQASCAAVDAGVALPNIAESFAGSAPDLGAYEFGRPLPIYGPRPLPVPNAPTGVRIITR